MNKIINTIVKLLTTFFVLTILMSISALAQDFNVTNVVTLFLSIYALNRCYEYIYKTLGLDSWMLGHNENAPYESFSLCGVTDEMDLFQYITLLKALINDRREGIVTQTGKKEKEQ